MEQARVQVRFFKPRSRVCLMLACAGTSLAQQHCCCSAPAPKPLHGMAQALAQHCRRCGPGAGLAPTLCPFLHSWDHAAALPCSPKTMVLPRRQRQACNSLAERVEGDRARQREWRHSARPVRFQLQQDARLHQRCCLSALEPCNKT